MDHGRVPVLEAFRRRGDICYGLPGHKQGRGVDPRVLGVLGEGVFASDVLMLNGLDAALRRAERVHAAVSEVPGVELLHEQIVDGAQAYQFDPLFVTIDVRALAA